MSFNLADIFEQAADAYPDRTCLVVDDQQCTYAEMEARANQLAHHLASKGVGHGDHVGIYAYNCIEWVETLWAVFKLRAVWININYRYVEDELAYIFANADLKALVVGSEFVGRVNNVIGDLSQLEHVVVIGDAKVTGVDTCEYEAALAVQSNVRDFGPRSDDDLYMIYTGGTTGMPKAVVWRHGDVLFALGGGIDQQTGEAISDGAELIEKGRDGALTMFAPAPLMHGAAQWAVMGGAFEGRKTVTVSQFDADNIWRMIEREQANGLFITGDAMARPLIERWQQLKGDVDASSLFLLVSTAAVFSQSLKDQFLDAFPNMMILDSIGSSESGGTGISMVSKGQVMKGGPTVNPTKGAVVLDPETLTPLPVGSGKTGMVARTGYIPLGYYRDEKKTAETFVMGGDGIRYVIPGDFATLEEDGTVTLLGRSSVCINSGGEKIFAEEVESAVKSHPAVYDVTVCGVPDERWGNRVAAVVELRSDESLTLESLQDHCRTKIAGYKIPREMHVVEKVDRTPSGKPDYRWAKAVALGEQA